MSNQTLPPADSGAEILQFSTTHAPPPPELTPEQSANWIEILATLPADWMTWERGMLLGAYVRCATSMTFLARQIELRAPGKRSEDFKLFSFLSRTHCRQAGLLMTLATKLGFTQQQTMRAEVAATRTKRGSKGKRRPWGEGG
jgi:hypothetical protein